MPPPPPPPAGEVPLLPPPPVFDQTALSPPRPPSPPPITMRTAPRVFMLSVGWSYMPATYLPLSSVPIAVLTPQGVSTEARLGWQVGGYQSGWNSYVGFRSSFSYYVGGDGARNTYAFDYGIFVKHMLFPGRRVRFHVGYGLGAVQAWVTEVGGRGIGHSTRLSAGLDTRISERVHVTTEFAYKYNVIGSFATEGMEPTSNDFHSISLLAGIWFGR